jgi:hypothetical protein
MPIRHPLIRRRTMTLRNETILGAVLAILASTLGFAITLM